MSHSRMSLDEFKRLGSKGSKFNARRCEMDGIKFDSLAEREFYALLKADKGVLHVDVHPTVTLPGGIRYKPDFCVIRAKGWTDHRDSPYHKWERTWDDLRLEYYEVKGAVTQDFRRMRKLFDATHPLAPLKVLRKTKRGWEEI